MMIGEMRERKEGISIPILVLVQLLIPVPTLRLVITREAKWEREMERGGSPAAETKQGAQH